LRHPFSAAMHVHIMSTLSILVHPMRLLHPRSDRPPEPAGT
jgi:uncharacterized protein YhhL (DUF1145 family)